MNLRTDMADERKEAVNGENDGIDYKVYETDGVKISKIRVTSSKGEGVLGKPKGTYVTLDFKSFGECGETDEKAVEILACQIRQLIPREGTVLIIGLGNEKITPDALGPKTAQRLLATRHISDELSKSVGMGKLRSTAVVIPGVLGRTGIETAEITESIVSKIKPSAVIAVDALASKRTERLGTSIQLSDTGICPGSGVGNSRAKMDSSTLNVPVIAIGMPTVVDAMTLTQNVLEKYGTAPVSCTDTSQNEMMVTPREIDLMIDRASRYIAMGINCALQENMKPADILSVMG